jgi:hypothetical protein
MLKRTVVAFCGRKRSGKDTAAQCLVDRGFRHEKFAAPLKTACSQLFGLGESQVHGDDKDRLDERWGCTPRRILQFVGTELFQHAVQELLPGVGRGFWARSLTNRILESSGHVVITDMRFQHELEALRALDAEVFEVVSIRVRRSRDPEDPEDDEHASETELEQVECDEVVHNDGDREELAARVRRLLGNTAALRPGGAQK